MVFRGKVIRAAIILACMAITLDAKAQTLPGSDIIPPARLADWRAGVTVGVPGGIPTNRTHLIDVTKPPYNANNTGAGDAQPAITNAIVAAAANDVVYLPAGTYRLNSPVNIAFKKNITIRGAGPDKTLVKLYSTWGAAFNVGGGADYQWNQPNLAITGSPAKGATVLNVGSTTPLNSTYPNGGIGQICKIELKNDYGLPVVSVASWEYMRRQTCRIVAKTSTTVTISPPLLFALPESLAPKLAVATSQAEFVGVEDLKIDATNSTSGAGMVYMTQCYGCWVKNVTVVNVANRHLWVTDCVQCDVRQCYTSKRQSEGTNGAGILVDGDGFCLFEDNILTQQFPVIEVINGASGNVFGYNYCYDSLVYGVEGCAIDTVHGGHSCYNLYEGNVSPNLQADGYHNSASDDTIFRNWFTGAEPGSTGGWTLSLNRFTRNYSVVGNIFGLKNAAWGGYSFGNPNMGNGSYTGTAQPSKGKYWADWRAMRTAAQGSGPGPGGFQELDLDVQATTLLKGNYNYRDKKVPANESLYGKKLPKSLYLSAKPSWFGKLAWPPFGPDTGWEKNKIPAQVRFEQMPK